MGVRIDGWAVDVPRLESLLSLSMEELFWKYHRDGVDPSRRLLLMVPETDDTYACAPQGRAFFARCGRGASEDPLPLTPAITAEIEFLQQSARDLLQGGSPYVFTWFFESFSHCGGVDCIEHLLDGQRRWWIGSVLQAAQTSCGLDPADFEMLLSLFRKVLREYDCAFPVPRRAFTMRDFRFPVLPEDDPDVLLGVWSEAEVEQGVRILDAVRAAAPRFTPTPGAVVGWPPATDEEWHAWVVECLDGLLKATRLDFEQMNIVTVIT